MASISPQTAFILWYMLDTQFTYTHILRLQLAANRALLLHIVNTYPSALTPADCAAIGDALAGNGDALTMTEAA